MVLGRYLMAEYLDPLGPGVCVLFWAPGYENSLRRLLFGSSSHQAGSWLFRTDWTKDCWLLCAMRAKCGSLKNYGYRGPILLLLL